MRHVASAACRTASHGFKLAPIACEQIGLGGNLRAGALGSARWRRPDAACSAGGACGLLLPSMPLPLIRGEWLQRAAKKSILFQLWMPLVFRLWMPLFFAAD